MIPRLTGCLRLAILAISLDGAFLTSARADDNGLTFRSEINATGNDASVLVRLNQPSTVIPIPENACLEYDIRLSPDNVSFGGGVSIVTLKGSVSEEPTLEDDKGDDTHFTRSETVLGREAVGRWYHRRIHLDRVSGSVATEIFVAASAGQIKSTGTNEVSYRNIRLTDATGKELTDLMPALGTLPYPLIVCAGYVGKVDAQANSLVSGSFQADMYLAPAGKPFNGSVVLRNFDPKVPVKISWSLTLKGLDGAASPAPDTTGETDLAPGEEKTIPVTWNALPAGNFRPVLAIQNGTQRAVIDSAAVTLLDEAGSLRRKKPFSDGGFGMGAVDMGGFTPVQSLPWLREAGANYFQIRILWSQVEVSPGHYDFSRLESSMQMARRCGMWLQIDLDSGYPAWSVPPWYQDQNMISSTGKSMQPGNCSTPYWSPARLAGLKTLQALLDKYKDATDVVAWNAWLGGWLDSFYYMRGKPAIVGLQDYSSWSQTGFRGYVRDVLHLTLQQASARYGLTLGKWDDLAEPLPRMGEVDLRPLWMDFMNYRYWTVAQVEKQASEAIAKTAPATVPEYFYGGGLHYSGGSGSDYDAGIATSRQFHGSMHYTGAPGAEQLIYLGAATRQFGVPYSIETAGTPAPIEAHQRTIFEMVAQNAAAFCYIRSPVWGTMLVPRADYGFGDFRTALERMRSAVPTGPSIAVVYPYSNMITDPWNLRLSGAKDADQFIRRMETVGYDIDVYTDRTPDVPWSKYPVVAVPFSAALDPAFVDAILSYVRGGGKLILISSTGEFTPGDETGRFALQKALGSDPTAAQPKAMFGNPRAIFVDGDLKGRESELSNYRPLGTIPKGSVVWATDRAGLRDVASWKVGVGEVLDLAGWPDFTTAAGDTSITYSLNGSSGAVATEFPTVADLILQKFTGIPLPMTCSTGDVLFAFRKKQGDRFLVLFNNSGTAKSAGIHLPIAAGTWYAYNLSRHSEMKPQDAGKDGLNLTIDLKPNEVSVIQLSPSPIEAPLDDFPVRTLRNPADQVSP